MATHSSILAWRRPRTEDPGGLPWCCKELDMTEWEIDGETVETVSDFIFGLTHFLRSIASYQKILLTFLTSDFI